MTSSLSQLIMSLEVTARDIESKLRTKPEAASDLEAVAEQLYRLAGRWKRGE